MRRFLVSLIANAIALWLTTLIVAGVKIDSFGDDGALDTILTYLFVALIFGIVNGIIGSAIRIVAFPLYILTLGIIALFVNALLLWLVSVVTGWFGFGLVVDGFWSTVFGALVLAILSAIIGAILRPLAGRRDR
ncbi:phage holin family protein [Herbiconiux sp. KACC 21604]|uniref:Phage holin family protein n=1 Tax=Herbiconiux sp. A18JL235 TaxID=3152363 RepID=A0AB39BHS1_9MICO|nr:phage holin family protein [Herbiconiux sp. SALV-R1]QJU55444.1 phage holin family protein [Herbiconiux sp. SALV-R1]WPO86626.1 phage holin family protein [Herbiconiux sp. KACC 21604]